MRLDILIPTYNRSALLRECIDSMLRSNSAVDWRVIVVDNNSSDDTRQVIESLAARSSRIRYVFEKKQGRSNALNAGIRASDADVVGMIDDDEQLHPDWIDITAKWFADPLVDFIGGPYLGLWRADKPPWVPPGFEGVISAQDPEQLPSAAVRFPDERFFVQGGNAVMRRSIFDRIGLYRADIGRIGNDFGSSEDVEMFNRLMANGLTGYYVPNLIVYHVIPPDRMTQNYYRHWVLGQAKSAAVLDGSDPQKVAYVGKIPRYMIGRALRGLLSLASSDPARRFGAELDWWRLAGFVRGAYPALDRLSRKD